MNRTIEIEDFLKRLAKYYKYTDITSDTVYNELVVYNLTSEEKNNRSIEKNFQNWINHYKYKKNMNCFEHERQKHFIQFWNGTPLEDGTNVKLYLNFDKENIEKCVQKVFDFIEKNNLGSHSKVADIVRADSCVLRLNSIEDANMVMNFINRDKELCNHARGTNPFLIKNGIVGMAYDGELSYNETISDVVFKYLTECKNNNTLDNVSMEELKNYAQNYKVNLFSSKEGIEALANSNLDSFCDDKEILVNNYEQILNLFITSLKENANIKDYEDCYKEFKKERNNKEKNEFYKSIIDKSYSKNLLNSYIKYEYEINSRNEKEIYLKIQGYMMSKDERWITRDHNFRALFTTYLNSNDIKKLIPYDHNRTFEYNDLENYVNNTVKVFKSNENDYNYFYWTCYETFAKYNEDQLRGALMGGLKGNFKCFTNEKYSGRDYLEKNFNIEKFKKNLFLLTNQQDINEMINSCCSIISTNIQNSMQAQRQMA